ncbi:hypothetical protein [Fischerella thermalis]|uniref:hypothetical protein n=1 Tax=Fischerella thermalis TaxID=372787 RepID=UPI0015E101A6|nr:hypothetical protein [Fischerella thermalis]
MAYQVDAIALFLGITHKSRKNIALLAGMKYNFIGVHLCASVFVFLPTPNCKPL